MAKRSTQKQQEQPPVIGDIPDINIAMTSETEKVKAVKKSSKQTFIYLGFRVVGTHPHLHF